MLSELVDNELTDKNTHHSYLDLYHSLVCSKKETAKNILEVGIYRGGSIKLWHDYFTNAMIYGLDHDPIDRYMTNEIKNKERIYLFTSIDAYNENYFNSNFLSKKIKFDFILDDGPHTLDSMKKFIKLYSQVMTDDGILIIEDVQDWDWIETLKKEVPDHLKEFIKAYDLRDKKGKYDDIVFTIDKLNQK
jgi:hypothetical protein